MLRQIAAKWRLLLTIGLTFSLLIMVCLISGCDEEGLPFVVSVHPLYLESDNESDPLLVGNWVDEEDNVTFVFEPAADCDYKLTVIEKEGDKSAKGEFDAHLVRLGGTWFLDILPTEMQGGSDFYRTHFIRVHTMARVSLKHDELQMAFLSTGWLKQQFTDKTVDLNHEVIEGTPFLTAPTEELQSLVDRYSHDEEAFPEPLLLHRVEGQKEEE